MTRARSYRSRRLQRSSYVSRKRNLISTLISHSPAYATHERAFASVSTAPPCSPLLASAVLCSRRPPTEHEFHPQKALLQKRCSRARFSRRFQPLPSSAVIRAQSTSISAPTTRISRRSPRNPSTTVSKHHCRYATHERAFPAVSRAPPCSRRSRRSWLPQCCSSAARSRSPNSILQKHCHRCATHVRAFPAISSLVRPRP